VPVIAQLGVIRELIIVAQIEAELLFWRRELRGLTYCRARTYSRNEGNDYPARKPVDLHYVKRPKCKTRSNARSLHSGERGFLGHTPPLLPASPARHIQLRSFLRLAAACEYLD